jgi:hypothetical protein
MSTPYPTEEELRNATRRDSETDRGREPVMGSTNINEPATSLLFGGSALSRNRGRASLPLTNPGIVPDVSDHESDDEALEFATLDAKMAIIGERLGISARRQAWILQQAESIVTYEKRHQEKMTVTEKFTKIRDCAENIAERYAQLRKGKASSITSTPTPSLIAEVNDVATSFGAGQGAIDNAPSSVTNREVRFEEQIQHGNTNRIPEPSIKDEEEAGPWKQRLDNLARRTGEIKLYGYSRIPDQGIMFDKMTAVDVWKRPREKARLQNYPDNQGSQNSTPPPVPDKDEERFGPNNSELSRPTFRAPSNTENVTRRSQFREQEEPGGYEEGFVARAREAWQSRPSIYSGPNPSAGWNHTRPKAEQARRYTPGYEMPRIEEGPIESIKGLRGISEAKEHHRSNMKDRLTRIIDDAIGVELPLPDGYKANFKPDRGELKKYSGSPKLMDLEEWLSATVYRYALQRLGGNRPEIDRVRVMFLLEHLEGNAYKWMMRHVTHINREVTHWTFVDVIHGLYDRFVHPSSMQDARENLNKVEYSSKEGIQGLYDNMREHAGGMAVYPDDYSLLSIFIDRIPAFIVTELLNTRGLTPEVNTLSEFVANALDVEQRKKNETYYKDRRTGDHPIRNSRTPKVATETKTSSKDVTPRRDERPFNKKFQRNYYHNRSTQQQEQRKQDRFHQQRLEDKPTTVSFDKPKIPLNQDRPDNRTGRNKYQWGKDQTRPKDGNNKISCFECGGNHFVKDCPNKKHYKSHLRAAHSVMNDGSGDEADDESQRDSDENRGEGPQTENEHPEDGNIEDMIEIESPLTNEYYEEDGEQMYALHSESEETQEVNYDFLTSTVVFPLKGNEKNEDIKMRRHKLIPSRKMRKRPRYSEDEKLCLATWTEINGLRAWTLWDSGSTTTGITPAFAEVAKIPADELVDPHILQLGTIGSRSIIKYGTDIEINLDGLHTKTYVDIANFDRYEMIIGTPFMRQHGVKLDFETNEVVIKNKRLPAVKIPSKEIDLVTRRYRTTDKKQE